MSRGRWIRNVAILFVAAVVGFPAVAMAAIHIKLKVNTQNNPPTLEVIENDAKCADGKIDCIEVPKGSWHNLFFDLDKACNQDGPQYKLSAFRLAEASKDWPTPAKPLKQAIVDDFDADPTTGYIKWDLSRNSLSESRIKLLDNNADAYSVYYEITATQCVGTGEAKLDPVIKNGGR